MSEEPWRLRPGLRLRRCGDEWLVLDTTAGRVHRVSGAAARTLGRLVTGRSQLEDGPAAALAQAGILEAASGRRDVLLGLGATGLMIATTVLPPAAAASSLGSLSYDAVANVRVTVIESPPSYRVLRIELATLDNGTVTQGLQFTRATTIDVMLVGGGGGGGNPADGDALPSAGGGGGGGEAVLLSGYSASAGNYSVRVGGAGADISTGGAGESGQPTVFASGSFETDSVDIAEAAGGGGGGGGAVAGLAGDGSGGGGSSVASATAGGDVTDVAGQRHDGGVGAVGAGGGGGGAGSSGVAATEGNGGSGGAPWDVSAFLGQTAGTTRVAAGGGGGGSTGGSSSDADGGGAGATAGAGPTVGTNGTGGGGGGGYRADGVNRTGSRGGTGVALIRIHLT